MAHGQGNAEVREDGGAPTLTCLHEAPIVAGSLLAGGNTNNLLDETLVPVAFSCKDHGADAGALSPTLRAMGHGASHANAGGQVAVMAASAVRRLTPRECERLQGFPDDYTAIPGAKDGPRYKALGNSMAVPVMGWIGERIAAVDAIESRAAA